MIEGLNIRLMREEDLPLIEWDGEYARYRQSYKEVYHRSQQGLSWPLIAETAADGMIGQIFLSAKNANPVYSPRESYLFLTSFRVKPAFRDRGVGGELMNACERVAREHHFGLILLNCAEDNVRGLAFYQKHGFDILRPEDCRWTYINENGMVVNEHQASYLMRKKIRLPGWRERFKFGW